VMDKNCVITATCGVNINWDLILVLPPSGLATTKARAMLPVDYSRDDAVANIQATALLVAAFAQGRGDLLRFAMRDRLHQPYREKACQLLPLLLPLAGTRGILGVALSGAGPSVLLIAERTSDGSLDGVIRDAVTGEEIQVIYTKIASGMVQG
jgi:homoserine kinase